MLNIYLAPTTSSGTTSRTATTQTVKSSPQTTTRVSSTAPTSTTRTTTNPTRVSSGPTQVTSVSSGARTTSGTTTRVAAPTAVSGGSTRYSGPASSGPVVVGAARPPPVVTGPVSSGQYTRSIPSGPVDPLPIGTLAGQRISSISAIPGYESGIRYAPEPLVMPSGPTPAFTPIDSVGSGVV